MTFELTDGEICYCVVKKDNLKHIVLSVKLK